MKHAASALVLMAVCQLLMLVIVTGLIWALARVGLSGLVLPVWCIGFPASIVLAFLLAVRLGRLLMTPGGRNG
jgi:hypothetical protein